VTTTSSGETPVSSPETTATVTVRRDQGRFTVTSPSGMIVFKEVDAGVLELYGLPVPPLPIPDPPEGCTEAKDFFGTLWYVVGDNLWKTARNEPRSWDLFVNDFGPVTPLIPGDPIAAPGGEQ
jgi:hypothetical protein